MPGRATNEPGNYFCFGFQSAKDIEASTFHFLKHLDGTGFEVEDEVQAEREGGDGQEIGYRYRSQVKGDGAMVANARLETAGRMLAAIQGQETVAVVSPATTPATHTHTTTPKLGALPYLTVEQHWADMTERTINCKATQLEIEWEAGRPLKFTLQFISGGAVSQRTGALLTPVRETFRPVMYPGAIVVLTGATGAKMTKGKLTIKREIDDDIYTSNLYREDAVETAYDVDFEGTLKYEDKTIYERAWYGAAGGTAVPVNLSTLGLDLLAARGTQSLQLIAPGLEIGNSKVNKLDPDGKTMYLDFSAMSVKSATATLTTKVVNETAAAYVV